MKIKKTNDRKGRKTKEKGEKKTEGIKKIG